MKIKYTFLLFTLFLISNKVCSQAKFSKILYGVAYYDEYMPYDRLDEDIKMMKDAGVNVVRIAESTWGTVEPQDSVYDFSHIDRVLNAMYKAGIHVIIGTPTYAIPTWLAHKYPDILAITPNGQNKYGARQNMDITNEHYLYYSERIIRKILAHVKDHPAIIGYQVDNETKAYGTAGPNVQKLFVVYMKNKFKTLDSVNHAFGLDYWSNKINAWEDFPSMVGSINASQNAEFAKFQRMLVTNFLAWQGSIVREYKHKDQFITQNFDYDWKGYSYGIQSEVDHFAAAKSLDVTGIDIYHPSQNNLTGREISFGGDVARSVKNGQNYLVMETEAQGFPEWTPYPSQLRLQAFSHLASGANMVEYWHWHSLHNSAETYWKGVLSYDFAPNQVYNEMKTIGSDLKKYNSNLINLQKHNSVAILFSNEALAAFNQFKPHGVSYNDVLRTYYDALYDINVGVDFVDPTSENITQYKLLIAPALYAASDSLLQKLNNYVKNGGHIIYSFKSGFSDQNVKVRTIKQPGLISDICGISYNEFTIPDNVSLKNNPFAVSENENKVDTWMELITPTTANVLAYYDHPVWGKYAAITENNYEKGSAVYIGCGVKKAVIEKILQKTMTNISLWTADQNIHFPIIVKNGRNEKGKDIYYYFNYSDKDQVCIFNHTSGKDLFSGLKYNTNTKVELEPWGFKIIELE